jgi:hypothetical protein
MHIIFFIIILFKAPLRTWPKLASHQCAPHTGWETLVQAFLYVRVWICQYVLVFLPIAVSASNYLCEYVYIYLPVSLWPTKELTDLLSVCLSVFMSVRWPISPAFSELWILCGTYKCSCKLRFLDSPIKLQYFFLWFWWSTRLVVWIYCFPL